MKKIEDVIISFDKKIDRSFGRFFAKIARHFSVFSSVILLSLFGIFIFKVVYNRSHYLASVLEQDIAKIAKIILKIDKECVVLSVAGELTPVNFLNVRSFVGSTIGGLNLAYPQKWQGPYLDANMTYQQRFYEIIQNFEGFFLVPGKGMSLPTGLVVGKDIIFSFDISIKQMLKDGGALNNNGHLFGCQLPFSKAGIMVPSLGTIKTTADKVNFFISEFNQAMPFTKNHVNFSSGEIDANGTSVS